MFERKLKKADSFSTQRGTLNVIAAEPSCLSSSHTIISTIIRKRQCKLVWLDTVLDLWLEVSS